MSEQTSEALRAWFKRVEPLYPELFNTAHVLCGNYDQAEDALRSAILEVYLQTADSSLGFKEKLRAAIRDEAGQSSPQDAKAVEFTWTGFSDTSPDTLARLASKESLETQRILMLRHGVGLSPGRIAQLMGLPQRWVKEALNRFETRGRRSLSARERGHFDAAFARAARRQLASRVGVPHPSGVYRAFEAEASRSQLQEHRVTQVFYRILVVVMALLCAALFWLFAVLVQPPELESAQPIESAPTPAAAFTETYYASEGQ